MRVYRTGMVVFIICLGIMGQAYFSSCHGASEVTKIIGMNPPLRELRDDEKLTFAFELSQSPRYKGNPLKSTLPYCRIDIQNSLMGFSARPEIPFTNAGKRNYVYWNIHENQLMSSETIKYRSQGYYEKLSVYVLFRKGTNVGRKDNKTYCTHNLRLKFVGQLSQISKNNYSGDISEIGLLLEKEDPHRDTIEYIAGYKPNNNNPEIIKNSYHWVMDKTNKPAVILCYMDCDVSDAINKINTIFQPTTSQRIVQRDQDASSQRRQTSTKKTRKNPNQLSVKIQGLSPDEHKRGKIYYGVKAGSCSKHEKSPTSLTRWPVRLDQALSITLPATKSCLFIKQGTEQRMTPIDASKDPSHFSMNFDQLTAMPVTPPESKRAPAPPPSRPKKPIKKSEPQYFVEFRDQYTGDYISESELLSYVVKPNPCIHYESSDKQKELEKGLHTPEFKNDKLFLKPPLIKNCLVITYRSEDGEEEIKLRTLFKTDRVKKLAEEGYGWTIYPNNLESLTRLVAYQLEFKSKISEEQANLDQKPSPIQSVSYQGKTLGSIQTFELSEKDQLDPSKFEVTSSEFGLPTDPTARLESIEISDKKIKKITFHLQPKKMPLSRLAFYPYSQRGSRKFLEATKCKYILMTHDEKNPEIELKRRWKGSEPAPGIWVPPNKGKVRVDLEKPLQVRVENKGTSDECDARKVPIKLTGYPRPAKEVEDPANPEQSGFFAFPIRTPQPSLLVIYNGDEKTRTILDSQQAWNIFLDELYDQLSKLVRIPNGAKPFFASADLFLFQGDQTDRQFKRVGSGNSRDNFDNFNSFANKENLKAGFEETEFFKAEQTSWKLLSNNDVTSRILGGTKPHILIVGGNPDRRNVLCHPERLTTEQEDIQKEKYRVILLDFFGGDENTFAPKDAYMRGWQLSEGLNQIYTCKAFFDGQASNGAPSFSSSQNFAYFAFDLRTSFSADRARSSLDEVFSKIQAFIISQRTE